MLIKIVLSLLVGLVAYLVAGAFGVTYNLQLAIGIIAGVLFYIYGL